MIRLTSVVSSLTLTVGLLLTAKPSEAAVVVRLSLAELVGEADTIVETVVRRAESRWSDDGRRIETAVSVEVSEGLRGAGKGETLTVHVLGGKVGNIRMKVPGSPVLAEGQEVLLFLVKQGARRQILGFNQGVFDLVRAADGTASVRQRLGGLTLMRRSGQGAVPLSPEEVRPLEGPLETFRARLRDQLVACAKEPKACRFLP